MAKKIAETVFLDTQVFYDAKFNLNSKSLAALRKHLESGRLSLLTTDITNNEIQAGIDKTVHAEVAVHKRFAKDAAVLQTSGNANVKGALAKLDKKVITDELQAAMQQFIDKYSTETLEATQGDAEPVFEKYFAGKPPFGNPADKKNEFPDAFVAQALLEWVDDNEEELIVVTGDKHFQEAFEASAAVHVKTNLVGVLDHVNSDNKKLARFLKARFKANKNKIAKQAWTHFESLGFHVIDEWGDVEVELHEIELEDDPEIVDISGKSVLAEMTFSLSFDAHLSFDDSDTGVWDGEDRVLLFQDHVNESHHASETLVVQVTASFANIDPNEFSVEDVVLIEPSKGYGFVPSKNAGYPYK